MSYIVLTVPHGSPYLDDVIAPFIVDQLEKLLKPNHVVLSLVNKMPRSFGDMNRPTTRGTPYRRVIDAVLRSDNKPDFLLDIHGFPDNTDSSLGGNDMVVLRSHKLQKGLPANYHRLLNKYKVEKNFKIGIQNASAENDVVTQAVKSGVPAVLIEHNESGPVGSFAQTHALVLNEMLK
jgi:hypothetical protein